MKPGTVVVVKHWWLFRNSYELGVVRFYDPVRDVAKVEVIRYEEMSHCEYLVTRDIVVPLRRLEKLESDNHSVNVRDNFWADVRSGLHDFAFTHKQADKTPVT